MVIEHENAHVAAALGHLESAVRELNLADGVYAIGLPGRDEPYGLAVAAFKRTVWHAFPELDADEVYRAMVESGEDLACCVRKVSQEKAERAAALEPFAEYRHPHRTGRFGAAEYRFPNGWLVSVVPSYYGREHDERAAREEEWCILPCVLDGDGRLNTGVAEQAGYLSDGERGRGYDYLAEHLLRVSELPPLS